MITLRIPTKEPYAYIEVQVDSVENLYPEKIKEVYDKYIQTFQSENKYSETTFNEMISKVMDSDLTDWQITTEEYEHLTDSQKVVYQSIKRFKKRLPEE